MGINFAEFDRAHPEESLGDASPHGFGTVDLEEAQRRAQLFAWMPDSKKFMAMLRFVNNTNPGPIVDSELGGSRLASCA